MKNSHVLHKKAYCLVNGKRQSLLVLLLIIGVMLVLCPLVSIPEAAETVPSRIREVTLFSDQALVKREASLKVGKGVQELILEVEAFRVDRDSVSAKVFGDGEIFSVQYRDVPLKDAPQEKIRALEQKIRALRKSVKGMTNEKDVLSKKEAFLKSVISFSDAQIPKEMKTAYPRMEDLDKTLRFLTANFQTIFTQKQSLDNRIEDTEKEIKVLERDLSSYQKTGGEGKRVIEIVFNSRKEQKLRIEADYLVQNAYWSPLYRVSVPASLDGIDLAMFSDIRQKTGEDWDRVTLAISNAVPLKGVALPSPGSWILDIERPRPKKAKAARQYEESYKSAAMPAPAMEKLMDNLGADDESEKKEAVFSEARREVSTLSFEYKMPQPMSIESRDKETLLPLITKRLQGEFFHYAVPRANQTTFLVCKTKADREFLGGPLNVYFGGRFVGKTILADKKAGEEVLLGLGADRDVKIKRETLKDKVKETIFGSIERDNIVREMAYRITLENMRDKPVKIRILDAVPISRSDRVEVKDMKITPEPKEKSFQGREGVLLWEADLKPDEKKEINVEFTVTYPKDAPLTGL